MVRIPYIKIPSVRVESISPTSNIGTGGATPAPPTPITYLTQWQLVGNSEVHGTEIWSCGEYSEVDNKWHIRILPEGYGIVDIALDEPLRKVNDVADTIEFADGVATLIRKFASVDFGDMSWNTSQLDIGDKYRCTSNSLRYIVKVPKTNGEIVNILTASYDTTDIFSILKENKGIGVSSGGGGIVSVYDENYNQADSATALKTAMAGVELIYELATPTTETIQVPEIQEADSYSMVISQGGKAVEWSSFETNSE